MGNLLKRISKEGTKKNIERMRKEEESTADEQLADEQRAKAVPVLSPEDRMWTAVKTIQETLAYYKCEIAATTTIDSTTGVSHNWRVEPSPLGEEES